jgi:predicted secreted protein
MARLTPVYGENILIQLETDVAGVYTHPAMINTTRALSLTTEVETDELIDIDDQSAPAVVTRRVRARDTKVDGAGMMNAGDTKSFADRQAAAVPFNVKIIADNLTLTGPMLITQLQFDGERQKMAQFSITLEQAGEMIATETD